MAENRILYRDYYVQHYMMSGALYLFRHEFYKHTTSSGCSGRISFSSILTHCPRCGVFVNAGITGGTYSYLKGRKCLIGSSASSLDTCWTNHTNGSSLVTAINTIYTNEGWSLELPAETVYINTSYGVHYPSNAHSLLPGNNIVLTWQIINNSTDSVIIKHSLQIRVHADWQSWAGSIVSPSMQTTTCSGAGATTTISSNRTVPSDWHGPCGVDYRILNETGDVLYNLIDETGTKLALIASP